MGSAVDDAVQSGMNALAAPANAFNTAVYWGGGLLLAFFGIFLGVMLARHVIVNMR